MIILSAISISINHFINLLCHLQIQYHFSEVQKLLCDSLSLSVSLSVSPMALFSPPNLQNLSAFSAKTICPLKPQFLLLSKKPNFSLVLPRATGNEGGMVGSAALEEKLDKKEEASPPALGKKEDALGVNGTAVALKFQNPSWVGGTWDLKQFSKDGKTNWDAVIDAEAKRRKWLEDNPESSSNEDPILFDTSIIPWWAWMKRFHLPEAELLNGRAAMIGFFMAYLVDSLTGVGLVDQMGNFFGKTLLFVAVVGVLLIRKNEDIDSLKKLFEETTLYDKQWQAAWKDESTSSLKKD